MSVHQFPDRQPSAVFAIEDLLIVDPQLSGELVDRLGKLFARGPKEAVMFMLAHAGNREGLLELSAGLAAWTAGPPMARKWRRRH